jgi:hypothetical protein
MLLILAKNQFGAKVEEPANEYPLFSKLHPSSRKKDLMKKSLTHKMR